MSVAKFYIWGGGRWREVSSASGEVAGWSRRARFVFARHGRLRVAPRRLVLAALQAHSDNLPSAVGLGPRLSVLSSEPKASPPLKALPSAAPTVCAYHHCCVYTHGCHDKNFAKCGHFGAPTLHECCPKSAATEVAAYPTGAALGRDVTPPRKTTDAAIQYSPTNQPTLTISLNKQTPHEADTAQPTTATLDTLLGKHSSPAKRRPSLTTTSTGTHEPGPKSTKAAKKKKRPEIDENDSSEPVCKELTICESDVMALRSYIARCRADALERFDADDDYKRMLFYAINPLVDVSRCAHTERALRHDRALPHFAARLGLTPRAHMDTTDSDDTPLNYLPRKGTTTTKNLRSRRDLSLKRSETSNDRKGPSSDGSRRSATRKVARKSTTQVARSTQNLLQSRAKCVAESSDSADDLVTSDKRPRKSPRHNTTASTREEPHESVKTLENIQNGVKRDSSRPLTKRKYMSDSSESDDKSSASKSNSLKISKVSKRPRTEATSQSRAESVTNRSASSDGLKRRSLRNQSTADDNSEGSRKRRRSALPSSVNYLEWSSSDETGGPSKVVAGKGSRPARNSVVTSVPVRKVEVRVTKPEQDKSVESVSREPTAAAAVAGPSNVDTHTISKRASSDKVKEYSNLEDHAIVSWVCVGGRARLVNGNSLWRELQEQYPRITGNSRSWHSLRNRYLRYILPSLGALHLPPHTVARLRAAAATGSLKRRGVVSRRASIFNESQVRSASTRTRTKHNARTSHQGDVPETRSGVTGSSSNTQRTGVQSTSLDRRTGVKRLLPQEHNARRTGSPSTSNRTGSPIKNVRRTGSTVNARGDSSPSNSDGSPSNIRRKGSPNSHRNGSPSVHRKGSPTHVRGRGSPRNLRRSGVRKSPSQERQPGVRGSPTHARRTRKLFNPKLVI